MRFFTPQVDIIDSHQHFWKLCRGDYSWLTPDLSVLYRDFMPFNYEAETTNLEIKRSIVVQAAATESETRFILDLANCTPFIAGVVGWVNMECDEALTQLREFHANPYFKGMRPMLQDIDDIDWIMNPQFHLIFKFLEEKGLSFDALIKEEHLSNIRAIAEKYPKLKVVIDHCAKPNIASQGYESWSKHIAGFKELQNVYVKFSGLITEANQGDYEPETYKPYFDHLMNIFGVDRIIWGSDWPVIKLNGDCRYWIKICRELVKGLSLVDQKKFWGQNSSIFYNLNAD